MVSTAYRGTYQTGSSVPKLASYRLLLANANNEREVAGAWSSLWAGAALSTAAGYWQSRSLGSW